MSDGPQQPLPTGGPAADPEPGALPSARRVPARTPPTSRKATVIAWMFLAVFIAGLAGVAHYFRTHDASVAKVGDCVTKTGGDGIAITGCDDSDADFTVVGRVENQSEIAASISACGKFDDATSSYWEGKSGEKGTVLCLAKKG